MVTVTCRCGMQFDAEDWGARCPKCGLIAARPGEADILVCGTCGSPLDASNVPEGEAIRCEACGQTAVPALPVKGRRGPPPNPVARVLARRVLPLLSPRWLLALALFPLISTTFSGPDDTAARLVRALQDHQEMLKDRPNMTVEDFLNVLPGERIPGALHPRGTSAHWWYALLSASAFWALILFTFPRGLATSRQLWTAGIFTGTFGILLLLGFQHVAAWSQGAWIRGGGWLIPLFYIVKFIGYSYNAAMNPENGFVLSMVGFTCGVGVCEEFCKAMPLLWRLCASAPLDVRGAALRGLASGIGFGIGEGVMYSANFYNGLVSGDAYIIRFVSCVALHAVWSAAGAILIWRQQQEIRNAETNYAWFLTVVKILAIPVVLHGLYDTLLKRDMGSYALLTAVASFAWFFFLYEWAARSKPPRGAVA